MNINISDGKIGKSSLVSSLRNSSHSLFEAFTLIAVVVLFYIFMAGPKKAEVAGKQDNLSKLQSQQASLDQKNQKMKDLIAIMKSRPDDVRHLDESLPLDSSTIGLQLFVEKLASDAEVVSSEINFNARNERAAAGDRALLAHPFAISRSLQTISGNIYVSGSFSQLENFIKKLEDSARFIDITDISMAASKEGVLDLKLNVQAYYYYAQ